MANIRQWDGVIVTFETVITHSNRELSKEYNKIEKIEYICYEDFNSLSLGKIKDTQKTFDQVQWVNNGHSLPMYTTFCAICENMLDIHIEYCCSSHQIKIAPNTRLGILKIMVKQITEDKTLCTSMTLQALQYFNLNDNDITTLIDLGKEHISLFSSSPAGMMLHSEQKEKST